MRSLTLLVTLVACAPHAAKVPADPPAALPPPPTIVAQPAAQESPPPDEATIKAKSHDFFDALDRYDIAAAQAMLAPSFVEFSGARFSDAKHLASAMQAQLDRHAPVKSRTWSDERVFAGPSSITFIGHSIQHLPPEGDRGVVDRDGWTTAVWVRDGASWKIALTEWDRGGIDAEKAKWNETFRIANIFKKEPNQLLVDTVKGKKPGLALDLLMGQGRNAIFLASQGWKVTGVDLSDEGIRIAKATAAKQKLKLDTIETDVDTWDLGKDKWDLVTMLYAGDDAKLVERVKPSLKKGGLFVLEYFHADSDMAAYGAGGWATGALAKLFAGGDWEIVRDDVVDDVSDWGMTKRKLVRFVARRK